MVAQKISHAELSLMVSKTRRCGWIVSSNLSVNKYQILYIDIKHCMSDLICDVNNCCILTCNVGEISVHNEIVFENPKKEKRWK